jgi:hypothetical protein
VLVYDRAETHSDGRFSGSGCTCQPSPQVDGHRAIMRTAKGQQ